MQNNVNLRIATFFFVFLISFILISCQKKNDSQVVSLLGQNLVPMELPPETMEKYKENLANAKADFDKDPNDVENIIWFGRRTAYLWHYRDAITIYSEGIRKYPDSYKLYRHRGHRYISVREFDNAIADLEKASQLIKGIPDEIEADGQPNKYNIPTSTSHFNIWYHLGLAYYLNGDFENALRAYLECMKFSKNNDALCATSDWLYMTYRRLGKENEAEQVLEAITQDMEIIENYSYHKRLLMYKGVTPPDSVLSTKDAEDLDIATQGYGVGNWYLYNGETEKAVDIFEKVVEGKYWAAFGYIAAEAELARK